ncbi:MAG TPA: DegT/DnrJ/EryC1/StrS family aminotransferase [Solirubrobacteraceae bacterium]|jgi:dTDP-4-amino-4,6-dideoxygalactose transaminase
MAVPLFDTERSFAAHRDRLHARMGEVLDGGRYILGPEVGAFEGELAAHLGAGHAVGVANGTDALTLALLALGVGPGDEVVVPAFTFWASAESIPPTGAAPVFCDVDLDTFCVTADTVKAALTPRTKAIVVVDLFGNPVDVEPIAALGLPIVEDAAQAAGSRLGERAAGTLGTIGTFSFFPSKNLGGFGDGGACVTDDAELAATLRLLRAHGSRDKQTYERIGVNSRLDELQAALLRVQLPELAGWAAARHAAGERYAAAGLGELAALPAPTPGATPAWHLYVIRHPGADALSAHLTAAGIGNRAYYRTPAHLQPAMRPWRPPGPLPVTDEAARTHLAIPMSAELTPEETEEVVAAVRAFSA